MDGLTFSGVTAYGEGTEQGSYPVNFSGVTVNETRDTTGNYIVTGITNGLLIISAQSVIQKELTGFVDDLAEYRITVNPGSETLNQGSPLTLKDTFDRGQSIIYSSIQVVCDGDVSYDYSGYTGTYMIPDGHNAVITYRTRVKGSAGETVSVTNTAVLGRMDGWSFVSGPAAAVSETGLEIQPTGSDIAGTGGPHHPQEHRLLSGNDRGAVPCGRRQHVHLLPEGQYLLQLPHHRRPGLCLRRGIQLFQRRRAEGALLRAVPGRQHHRALCRQLRADEGAEGPDPVHAAKGKPGDRRMGLRGEPLLQRIFL